MPVNNKPRTLPELFANQDNSALSDLVLRSRQLQGLNQLLGNLLGPELAAHCHLANIRGSTLVLTADSSAWATRVRYQSPQLLQKVRSDTHLSGIDNIVVRVTSPVVSADTSHSVQRASISETASECLNQCAVGIDDPHLRSALQHLAKQKRSDS